MSSALAFNTSSPAARDSHDAMKNDRGSVGGSSKGNRHSRRHRAGAGKQEHQQQQQQQQQLLPQQTPSTLDATQEEKILSKTLFKTKICSFWLRKCCTKTNCTFAHGDEELHRTPDFTNTMLCRFIVEKGVCKSSKCKYAHSEAELRPQQPLPGDTRPMTPRSPLASHQASSSSTAERLDSRCQPLTSDASTDCSASSPDEEPSNFEAWSAASTPACLSGANVQAANMQSGAEHHSFQMAWHSGDVQSSPIRNSDGQVVGWSQAFTPMTPQNGQEMGFCPYVLVPMAAIPPMSQMEMAPMAPPMPHFPSMGQGQGMQQMPMMPMTPMSDGNGSPVVDSTPVQGHYEFGVEQMLRNAMPEYYEE